MTYRYKGKFLSQSQFNSYSNLRNVKKYLEKSKPAKLPPKKPPARKKPSATKPVLRAREIERATREAMRRDSDARQRELERKAEERQKRKRERISKQGLIIRDTEEDQTKGYKNIWEFAPTRQNFNLRVTRIRKTYQPGYKKVHRGIARDTRYTKAVLVAIPFKIGPGTNSNEEMEVFMEKVLSQTTLPGDEEFYGTIETKKRKRARTIAKRQEIPMELRRIRHRGKPR